jgi:hypothetical protein
MMANVYWQKQDLQKAEDLVSQSISIEREMGHIEGAGFDIIKLGHIAQARGDAQTALTNYREGLAIFEKLGMPREIAQVSALINSLEQGTHSETGNPLQQAIAHARAAAKQGDIPAAIQAQQEAVSLARQAGSGREDLVTLSVMLFNLAGYFAQAERHSEAVEALAEVVAIDEKTGHPDLASDRQALENARRMAALPPAAHPGRAAPAQETPPGAENDLEAQIRAQIETLPPEQRPQAEAAIRKAIAEFQSLTPEEQAAALAAAERDKVEAAAVKFRDAALAYARRQAPQRDVLNYLRQAQEQCSASGQPGSAWDAAGQLCAALIAAIQGQPIPPVPPAYAGHLSAVQSALKEML